MPFRAVLSGLYEMHFYLRYFCVLCEKTVTLPHIRA